MLCFSSDAGSSPSLPGHLGVDLVRDDIEREIAAATADVDMQAVADAAPAGPAPPAIQAGDLVQGTVVTMTDRELLIELGNKVQGIVARNEFMPGCEPPPGAAVNVVVERLDEQAGLLRLSKKKADVAVAWRDTRVGDVVEGIVCGMNKGGLEVALGLIRAFIPGSQVDTHFLKDISELLGQRVRCEVTKIDRAAEQLVVSRRKVLEREAAERKARILAEMEVGQVRTGRVRNLTEYGAFIDLGGVDGLLHISDMSWGRIANPADVVKIGDEVQVQILKVHRESQKVSLGLKQLRPNPWDGAAERYAAGMRVKGRIVRLADFGAFAEIEPGLEGLVPISEMTWHRRIRHPKEVVHEGDLVDLVVMLVDPAKHRMTLSLRQIAEDPWAAVAEKYPPGSKLLVKVLRIADFGAFVQLEPEVDGMIHISELSPQRVKAVSDVVQPGVEVEARVLRVDRENHRIALSLRPEPVAPPAMPAPTTPAKAAATKAKPRKQRRGGMDFGWGEPLVRLDPSRYAP